VGADRLQLPNTNETKISKFIEVAFKKLNNLFSNPIEVYHRYSGRLKAKIIRLMGGIPPIYNEDYNKHWNFTSFKDKVILDLGADYGSTAYYFLRKGANKVIAVEGNSELAAKMKLNFKNDDRVIAIHEFIDSSSKIENLISVHHPDLIKVDIEGSEMCILDMDNVGQVNEWLIETHSNEIYNALSRFLTKEGFSIRSIDYAENLRVIYAFNHVNTDKNHLFIGVAQMAGEIKNF
jgi:predicted RNA methylase